MAGFHTLDQECLCGGERGGECCGCRGGIGSRERVAMVQVCVLRRDQRDWVTAPVRSPACQTPAIR